MACVGQGRRVWGGGETWSLTKELDCASWPWSLLWLPEEPEGHLRAQLEDQRPLEMWKLSGLPGEFLPRMEFFGNLWSLRRLSGRLRRLFRNLCLLVFDRCRGLLRSPGELPLWSRVSRLLCVGVGGPWNASQLDGISCISNLSRHIGTNSVDGVVVPGELVAASFPGMPLAGVVVGPSP